MQVVRNSPVMRSSQLWIEYFNAALHEGIVQRIFDLKDGTAVKLTVSTYYTPNGNNIHGIGIEPDVEVELDESLLKKTDIEHDEDNQLQEAIKALDLD